MNLPSTSPTENDRVCVYINDIPMSFNVLDTLYSLETHFGIKNLRYVANGRILEPALSMKFNGIKDSDRILVISGRKEAQQIPRIQQTQQQQRMRQTEPTRDTKEIKLERFKERFETNWADKFTDPDPIFEKILGATNPVTSLESARLSDLFKMRVEGNAIAFRRVCSKITGDLYNELQQKALYKTVLPTGKPRTPSTGLLPGRALWATSVPKNEQHH